MPGAEAFYNHESKTRLTPEIPEIDFSLTISTFVQYIPHRIYPEKLSGLHAPFAPGDPEIPRGKELPEEPDRLTPPSPNWEQLQGAPQQRAPDQPNHCNDHTSLSAENCCPSSKVPSNISEETQFLTQ
jgi:hypothetical protein